jgi:hypothetical protein
MTYCVDGINGLHMSIPDACAYGVMNIGLAETGSGCGNEPALLAMK